MISRGFGKSKPISVDNNDYIGKNKYFVYGLSLIHI